MGSWDNEPEVYYLWWGGAVASDYKGSHIHVTCSDRDQEFWSVKIVLDHLIAPFQGSWLLDFTGVQRTKRSHASVVSKKVRWLVDISRSEFVLILWLSPKKNVYCWFHFNASTGDAHVTTPWTRYGRGIPNPTTTTLPRVSLITGLLMTGLDRNLKLLHSSVCRNHFQVWLPSTRLLNRETLWVCLVRCMCLVVNQTRHLKRLKQVSMLIWVTTILASIRGKWSEELVMEDDAAGDSWAHLTIYLNSDNKGYELSLLVLASPLAWSSKLSLQDHQVQFSSMFTK